MSHTRPYPTENDILETAVEVAEAAAALAQGAADAAEVSAGVAQAAAEVAKEVAGADAGDEEVQKKLAEEEAEISEIVEKEKEKGAETPAPAVEAKPEVKAKKTALEATLPAWQIVENFYDVYFPEILKKYDVKDVDKLPKEYGAILKEFSEKENSLKASNRFESRFATTLLAQILSKVQAEINKEYKVTSPEGEDIGGRLNYWNPNGSYIYRLLPGVLTIPHLKVLMEKIAREHEAAEIARVQGEVSQRVENQKINAEKAKKPFDFEAQMKIEIEKAMRNKKEFDKFSIFKNKEYLDAMERQQMLSHDERMEQLFSQKENAELAKSIKNTTDKMVGKKANTLGMFHERLRSLPRTETASDKNENVINVNLDAGLRHVEPRRR